MQPVEEQSHQRTVVEDPTDRLVTTVPLSQILLAEQQSTSAACIAQIQSGEGHQRVIESRPEIKTLKQASTGVSDGVGPAAALQFRGREWVFEQNASALLSQSKSEERSRGTGSSHMDQ